MSSLCSRSLNGFHSLVYRSGDSYYGDLVDSKAQGRGTFNYNLAKTEFADSMRRMRERPNARRLRRHDDKSLDQAGSYAGQWQESRMNGFGQLTFPNGDRYTGEIHRNVLQGRGTFRCAATHDEYIGNFANNMMHGSGVLFYSCGDVWEGTYCEGQQTGRCELHYASGDWYFGEQIAGDQTGDDCEFFHLASDTLYRGPMLRGMRHGIGEVTCNATAQMQMHNGDKTHYTYKAVFKNGELLHKIKD